jgi:hypothetical protein
LFLDTTAGLPEVAGGGRRADILINPQLHTMQGALRKADMIELHDAGTVVYVEDLPQQDLGWRDAPTVVGKRVSVDGNELGRLLHAIGVSFDAEDLYDDEFDVVFHRPMRMGEEKADVSLRETLRVKELLARPDGPRTLHVQVTAHPADDPEEEIIQELTYCGSFTVWWSKARS